ncbi:hypothetical protein ElyMa_003283900 [Elysia marginata]|uniref:Uncharacterized protein n=1 Tax=Elysia marginata TaxID=1093978 RepID=A0AAV4J8Y7_9GAST|nr:hypothetical protein ElyMa_003283900 [Elysia marginata]
MDLAGLEVATAKMRPVIKCIAQYLFDHRFKDTDLPYGNTCQNIVDEGHFLAKQYIAEKLKDTDKWGLHKQGKRKFLDSGVCLENGETFSIGFSQAASETRKAITDDSLAKLHEAHDTSDNFKNTMKKLTYTMTDRASNEKKATNF